MLNLNAGTSDGAVDVTDETFMLEVVEASHEKPVVVDFWAPWCGPCKALGPELEKAVAATEGKVKLVKVNVDENQMFAGQLRVQSIPAVFGFYQGQPHDGFMGNLPPARLQEFIQNLINIAGEGKTGVEDLLLSAEEMLTQGNPIDAAELFGKVLEQDPENLRAIGGLISANLSAGQIETAKGIISMVPEGKRGDANIAKAMAKIEVAEEAAEAAAAAAGSEDALAHDPDNHQARYDLALSLLAKGDKEGAVDHLLELFRRDREWNDGAARSQLFKLFESFGDKDPVTLKGRRRLASMIYA